MYLPTEGLFAEVVRRPGLIDVIQRECHVMVAGPTTLFTLLTAMRMGFRSLAIQKRSAEVWKVLGAVKTNRKFGGVIDKVSKKLARRRTVIDDEVGRRAGRWNASCARSRCSRRRKQPPSSNMMA